MKKNIRVVRSWSLLLAVLGMVVCMFAGPLVDAVAFNWGNHTLHFILLSPIVGLIATAAAIVAAFFVLSKYASKKYGKIEDVAVA